ncbi:DUF4433 domain-containing protein [Pseudomonas gingeri]|uniref:DarT ssDNA thymidine ADP-ribosyltransferase family protein n=1 Tax=Pseudomonas gingeri TaxID=117681 RepID=UPI0015BB51BB|nr:DarT ssDNA thymidine ADP-ribosyltransferase family protein [Pseudomonas gingeri]NWE71178.1 DUF4433 domain-containing protein [Pseudomonas gingeri]
MPDIKDQTSLYHLTSLENLSNILRDGLKPRAHLAAFVDIADGEILTKRQALALENYVPFHWFSKNPFEGSVQRSKPNAKFVLISVYRTFARSNNWKIIPRHPLANDAIQLLNYNEGFEAIEWEVMNRREYHDTHCKSVCMAECLSPGVVLPRNFARLYVQSAEIEAICKAKMQECGLTVPISVNPGMFFR